jgi:ubiquinone/menaquinone biosynthesis C-methylase UbiE
MSQTPANEEGFHDDWADGISVDDVKVDEFFETCTSPENRWLLESLGNIEGKKILELGSGAGEGAVYMAKQGAQVTASDISSGMLNLVRRVADHHGVEVATVQCSAEKIPFEDESFDIVYAANVLHHVDLDATLAEAKRVLKPGGIFASWDPLAHNPLINLYRRMAKDVRTDDEHPLRMRDVKVFRKYFGEVQVTTTWFFTLWIFMRFYLIERVDPNKERYWKRILTEHKRLEPTYRRLERLEHFLLRAVPFLRRYCWNIVLLARK